jgi:putative membrane protein
LGFVNNREIIPIAFVGIGAILGIVGFAKIIDKLLKSHKDNTLYFIIGLIVGSLIEIWPDFNPIFTNILINIFTFTLGVVIVKLMTKLEGTK